MINQLGPRRLISFGMIVTGIGTLLFLLTGVDGSATGDILPAFMVMGFGMSFIWAPMTTAVLNSVEPEKSGVASAVNGAMREIGTAFGIALLGTIANRAYQDNFNGNSRRSGIARVRREALQPVIDLVGSGMNFGGHVISLLPDFAGLRRRLDTMEQASAEAFMIGMDRAIIFSTVGIIIAAVISYFLIEDEVVERALEPDGESIPRPGDVDFRPTAAD